VVEIKVNRYLRSLMVFLVDGIVFVKHILLPIV